MEGHLGVFRAVDERSHALDVVFPPEFPQTYLAHCVRRRNGRIRRRVLVCGSTVRTAVLANGDANHRPVRGDSIRRITAGEPNIGILHPHANRFQTLVDGERVEPEYYIGN